MRVLVTGARGKVGRHTAAALRACGHRVHLTDIVPAPYGPQPRGTLPYMRADLTDYGQTVGVITRCSPDVIVHAAGIPAPGSDPAATLFANNTLANFNIVEAVASLGVRRLVYISSETVPGYVTALRPFMPDYFPVDEAHPVRPQEAYALSKAMGEQLCDALVARSDATAVSVRPSWVLAPSDYDLAVPALQSAPVRPHFNGWAYVDVDDLADLIVLAATADTAGHEVVYGVQPDNLLGRPFAELVREAYGDTAPPLRPLPDPNCSGISCAKALSMFGWAPKHSWRDRLGGDAVDSDSLTSET
ncbi:MAG: NAD-dependent epimerase/dehydratase family protein [Acidimicrobiia bacterium]